MEAPSCRRLAAALLACTLSAPAGAQAPPAGGAPTTPSPGAMPVTAPTAADAKAFVAAASAELKRLSVRGETAEWIRNTYITDDTERNAAAMSEDLMAFLSKAIPEAARFDGVQVDPDTRRMLQLLKLHTTLPAPRDPTRRRELADLTSRLEGLYGKAKWCAAPRVARTARAGAKQPAPVCHDVLDTEKIFRESRDPAALRAAWEGWHSTARETRPLYARAVELANEGAREIGFADLGALWRSRYDMTPDELTADVQRLWADVKPLYEELHCFVRARLQRIYGKALVPDGRPIPAHLLGNVWAQEWEDLYPLLEPYRGVGSIDLTAALKRQKYDAVKMVKRAEAFYVSLGLDPLPETFWERSLLVKPRDREVVCHASAWDVTSSGDLRVKMCIRPVEEDFITIHHELGHNYYQRAYLGQPYLFQESANEGFHEALGDTISPLSMTPAYLARIGLLPSASEDRRAVIDHQLKEALEGVAFLPFGLLVDEWRWEVFAGKLPPERWNARWWELRRELQGVDAPLARGAQDFDPGAKYHVAAYVPYLRYFLARVYQYQFHRALCAAAGWQGPLHACSIYGSREAGSRLRKMMEMGASRPWPDAMQALTGQRTADASALLEYYAPLRAWLREQNAGQRCGWSP
jgi:peptidyl-dipeptidase A